MVLFLCFILLCTLLFSQTAQTAPSLFYNQGQQAQLSENYYEAIELYKKALELNANYKEPLFGLAESYFFLNPQ